MSEKCSRCNGTKKVSKFIFFCTNPECSAEIGEPHYNIIPKNTGNSYDDIIEVVCPECNTKFSDTLGEMDYEERISLCDCSKDMFEAKIELSEELIQGRFPIETWKREIRWYQTQTEYWKQNSKTIQDILSFINDEYRSVYNIYWLTGGPQSGITSLAVIFAKQLISSKKKAHYISMHTLLERSKDFDDKNFLENLYKNDVIILDDTFSPGKFFLKSDYVIAQFYNFIKEIVIRNKTLMCTSSKRIQDIDEKEFGSIKEVLKANSYEFYIFGALTSVIQDEKAKKLAELRGKK